MIWRSSTRNGGVLRPFDLVQPYRLEMKTDLHGEGWNSLYEFWRGKVMAALNESLAGSGTDLVVNLASNEYAKLVRKRKLAGRMLDIQFKEEKKGKFRTIGYYAKVARGLMARHLIQSGSTDPEAIRAFATDGYRFNPDLSTEKKWVFTRLST